MKRVLSFAHTRDASDGFKFYALAAGKLDTGDLEFARQLEDIESLNMRVLHGEVDVAAISIYAYARVAEDYALLPHGLAFGEDCGPRVVAREPLEPADIEGRVVAVPGQLTSAHLALRLFQPDVEVRFVRVDEVVGYVNDGFADAGVVIHEAQVAYAEAGLHLVLDLSAWWRGQTGLPLPLVASVARRRLGGATIARVSRYIRDSIQYALAHRREVLAYTAGLAGGLSAARLDELVGMYVNRRALDPGEEGREAVRQFLERGYRARFLDRVPEVEFFER